MANSTLKMLASVIVLGTAITPAFADHHNHDRDHDGINDRVERQWAKDDYRRARSFRTYPSDWNDQRLYYANNWNRRNSRYDRAQRAALEASMRDQWNAYYPNYRGQYNWNMYNNPGFLDYVHNGNPGLFTQIRSYIGI